MASGSGSHFKQAIVGIVVALVVSGSAPWWWGAWENDARVPDSGIRDGDRGGENARLRGDGSDVLEACAQPSLSLSKGSGPSGTRVAVSGKEFPPDEEVTVRFHTEELPPAQTDADGAFQVDVVIPGSFDAFAPQQFDISATTTPTICSESTPFELTA